MNLAVPKWLHPSKMYQTIINNEETIPCDLLINILSDDEMNKINLCNKIDVKVILKILEITDYWALEIKDFPYTLLDIMYQLSDKLIVYLDKICFLLKDQLFNFMSNEVEFAVSTKNQNYIYYMIYRIINKHLPRTINNELSEYHFLCNLVIYNQYNFIETVLALNPKIFSTVKKMKILRLCIDSDHIESFLIMKHHVSINIHTVYFLMLRCLRFSSMKCLTHLIKNFEIKYLTDRMKMMIIDSNWKLFNNECSIYFFNNTILTIHHIYKIIEANNITLFSVVIKLLHDIINDTNCITNENNILFIQKESGKISYQKENNDNIDNFLYRMNDPDIDKINYFSIINPELSYLQIYPVYVKYSIEHSLIYCIVKQNLECFQLINQYFPSYLPQHFTKYIIMSMSCRSYHILHYISEQNYQIDSCDEQDKKLIIRSLLYESNVPYSLFITEKLFPHFLSLERHLFIRESIIIFENCSLKLSFEFIIFLDTYDLIPCKYFIEYLHLISLSDINLYVDHILLNTSTNLDKTNLYRDLRIFFINCIKNNFVDQLPKFYKISIPFEFSLGFPFEFLFDFTCDIPLDFTYDICSYITTDTFLFLLNHNNVKRSNENIIMTIVKTGKLDLLRIAHGRSFCYDNKTLLFESITENINYDIFVFCIEEMNCIISSVYYNIFLRLYTKVKLNSNQMYQAIKCLKYLYFEQKCEMNESNLHFFFNILHIKKFKIRSYNPISSITSFKEKMNELELIYKSDEYDIDEFLSFFYYCLNNINTNDNFIPLKKSKRKRDLNTYFNNDDNNDDIVNEDTNFYNLISKKNKLKNNLDNEKNKSLTHLFASNKDY